MIDDIPFSRFRKVNDNNIVKKKIINKLNEIKNLLEEIEN